MPRFKLLSVEENADLEDHIFQLDYDGFGGIAGMTTMDLDDLRRFQDEVFAWAIEQFGPATEETWYAYGNGFRVVHENNAMTFKLRWC
ncbi:MAG: hypothetical protein EOP83_07920 [Verrucomicrobiaceae bacterium]|nr:MAG: hypothetical protein EOP83_07920 [Verrucomicrobiaceae bacterium]